MRVGITWLKQAPKAMRKAIKEDDKEVLHHIADGIERYIATLEGDRRRRKSKDKTPQGIIEELDKVLNKYRVYRSEELNPHTNNH